MRKAILGVTSLILIGAGVALAALFFLNNSSDPKGFNVPEFTRQQTDVGGPEDKTLTLTVPSMERIKDSPFPSTFGEDEESLKNYAGIHLEGTGFPWQEEANVYLAGHRLGYPGTPSFLAFYDQDDLQNGDEIYVTDSEGKEYTYRVYESFVVSPTDLWVIDPVPGKNILTLQTCTLPDYSQRLITRAELVEEA